MQGKQREVRVQNAPGWERGERLLRPGAIRRSSIKRKPRKRQPGDDPTYRAFVRTFGCVACFGGIMEPDQFGPLEASLQGSITECAHVGARGLSQKCPDCESLPLCAIEHHRVGPESHHKLGKRFWGFHGLDRMSLIKQMQELFRLNGGGQ